jgi:hypothetical protein
VGVARFVFLSGAGAARLAGGKAAGAVVWVLLASNNRTLGRGCGVWEDYQSCREAVAALQKDFARIETRIATEDTGRFAWWAYVDDAPAAQSYRSFLRARECSYNLDRFSDAAPMAVVTEGIRVVRR